MSEFRRSNSVPLLDLAARCNSIRDKMLVGLVLFTLVRTGEALAGDPVSISNPTLDPNFGNLRQPPPPARAFVTAPEFFTAPTAADRLHISPPALCPLHPTLFSPSPPQNPTCDTARLDHT